VVNHRFVFIVTEIYMTTIKAVKAGFAGAAAVLGAACLSPDAHAQTATGAYVGVGAGLNMPTNSTTTVDAGVPTNLDFNTGYNVLGTIGYKWNPNIRTEFEVDYRRAGIGNVNGTPAGGHEGVLSFSGNVLYDFNVSPTLAPYIGGGLGIAREHFGQVNTGPASPDFNDSDANLQWQLIGGVSTPIGGRASLFAEYRYIGVASNSFTGPTGDYLHDHYDHSHNVLVGLRFFL
jgi:opacity protein-like surface antigen